jgi:hypothetical protein
MTMLIAGAVIMLVGIIIGYAMGAMKVTPTDKTHKSE